MSSPERAVDDPSTPRLYAILVRAGEAEVESHAAMARYHLATGNVPAAAAIADAAALLYPASIAGVGGEGRRGDRAWGRRGRRAGPNRSRRGGSQVDTVHHPRSRACLRPKGGLAMVPFVGMGLTYFFKEQVYAGTIVRVSDDFQSIFFVQDRPHPLTRSSLTASIFTERGGLPVRGQARSPRLRVGGPARSTGRPALGDDPMIGLPMFEEQT